jgi:Tfp pilus assembly protein PilF
MADMFNMKRIAAILLLPVCLTLAGCAATPEKASKTDDLTLMHREAQAAYDNGDDARAELLYKKLTTLAKQDAETWLRLGNIYARTNNPQSAVESYRTSLSINDADPRTWNNLGIVMLRQSWMALVHAKEISNPSDAAYLNSADIIRALERLPAIMSEKAK